MAPAAVQRDFQIGIVLARNLDDEAGRALQAGGIEHKMRRLALRDPRMHHGAAFAHGLRPQECSDGWSNQAARRFLAARLLATGRAASMRPKARNTRITFVNSGLPAW